MLSTFWTRQGSIRRRSGSSPKAPIRSRSAAACRSCMADDDIAVQSHERFDAWQRYPMRLATGVEGNMNVKYLRRLKLVEQLAMSYEARPRADPSGRQGVSVLVFLQSVKRSSQPSPGLRMNVFWFYGDLRCWYWPTDAS